MVIMGICLVWESAHDSQRPDVNSGRGAQCLVFAAIPNMRCERRSALEKCRATVSILHRHEVIGQGWVPTAVEA
jgi:hypothetical protein